MSLYMSRLTGSPRRLPNRDFPSLLSAGEAPSSKRSMRPSSKGLNLKILYRRSRWSLSLLNHRSRDEIRKSLRGSFGDGRAMKGRRHEEGEAASFFQRAPAQQKRKTHKLWRGGGSRARPRPHPVSNSRDLSWQLHYATACPDGLRSSCRLRKSPGR